MRLDLQLAQSVAPTRDPSFWDLAVDAAGLLLYATSIPLLRRVPMLERRWRS